MDWNQDILDEYPDLDMDLLISYNNSNAPSGFGFWINLFHSENTGTITPEKYPISKSSLEFLNDRLGEHEFEIPFKNLSDGVFYQRTVINNRINILVWKK